MIAINPERKHSPIVSINVLQYVDCYELKNVTLQT